MSNHRGEPVFRRQGIVTKSQHFAVGTFVLAPSHKRGKIIARRGEYLTVLWDDGTLTTDRTQALVNNPH